MGMYNAWEKDPVTQHALYSGDSYVSKIVPVASPPDEYNVGDIYAAQLAAKAESARSAMLHYPGLFDLTSSTPDYTGSSSVDAVTSRLSKLRSHVSGFRGLALLVGNPRKRARIVNAIRRLECRTLPTK